MITELAYNLSKDFSNMDTETSIAIPIYLHRRLNISMHDFTELYSRIENAIKKNYGE